MTRQPEGGKRILKSSAEGKRERKGSGKLPVNPIEQKAREKEKPKVRERVTGR